MKYGSHFISRCDEVSDVIQLLLFDYTSLLPSSFLPFFTWISGTLDKKVFWNSFCSLYLNIGSIEWHFRLLHHSFCRRKDDLAFLFLSFLSLLFSSFLSISRSLPLESSSLFCWMQRMMISILVLASLFLKIHGILDPRLITRQGSQSEESMFRREMTSTLVDVFLLIHYSILVYWPGIKYMITVKR